MAEIEPKQRNSNAAKGCSGSQKKAKSTSKPIRVVVKRRKRSNKKALATARQRLVVAQKPGIPNLTKELTEPPPEDDNDENDDDELFLPLDDAIPCDTLLAFQSLTCSPHLCLSIPLQASMNHIPCILESQLVPALQQSAQDHNSFAMVTQELADLFHRNVLRRLTFAGNNSNSSDALTVLLSTEEYIRGVWDAHDTQDNASEEQRATVVWFVEHLHRWTGRILSESKLRATWTRNPPLTNLPYFALSSSCTQGLEYLQQIQVLMPNHSQAETTYQLWLPEWGQVLAAFSTAHKRFLQKIQQTYQKEISEKSFLQHPFYKGISSKLLLQWLQDQGIVTLVPKPVGKFISLVDKKKKKKRTSR
ncbi:expressed unknown protein [Seminavis robusta]|uniref:Uncharacterized protein n=1 Tax=Seminavis robusta TaxID=568900 RepID=A0A9N8EZS8_9STRA|nr:expressed unknown protein [Seminavis robusta]|eukprot:Sro2357_g324580.1 n/a (362) ;mRNA; f:2443-3528